MKKEIEAGRTQGKGQHHASHRNRAGLHPHSHQFIELALQTGEEQQGEQAELGHGLQAGEGFVVNLLHRPGTDLGQGTHQPGDPGAELGLGFRRHDQMQT